MKHSTKIIGLVAFLAGLMMALALNVSAQSGSVWFFDGSEVRPSVSSWGVKIPSLTNESCIGTDGSGVLQSGTCGGGGTSAFFASTTDDTTIYPLNGRKVLIGNTSTSTTAELELDGSTIVSASSTFLGDLTAGEYYVDGTLLRNFTETLTNKTIDTANNTITVQESDISDLSHYTDTDTADYINASSTILDDNTESGLETYLSDVSDVFTNNDGALDDDDLSDDNISALSNVDDTGVGNWDILTYNGNNWVDTATTTFITEGENISQLNNDSGYLTTVDISDDTNLVAGNQLTLTDDTLDSQALATSSIDTSAEINAIITDGALDDDDLSDNDTGDLSEGSNLYYTDTRVESVINASSTIMNTVDFDTEAEFESALFSVTTIGETVETGEITDATVRPRDIATTSAANDNELFGYDASTGNFEPFTCAEITGSADLCDGSDDGTGGSGEVNDVSTSTVPTVGDLAYWTDNGDPSLLGSVSTTSATIGSGLSYSGTFGYLINGADGTLTVDEANVDHDSLQNFVANEHIDWTTDQGATNIDPSNITGLTLGVEVTGSIEDLSDVNSMTPAGGDILAYNGGWTNMSTSTYITEGENISQLNNDSGYLTSVDFSDDTNATAGNLITFSDDTIHSNALATSSIDTASEFNSIVTDGSLDDDDLSDDSIEALSDVNTMTPGDTDVLAWDGSGWKNMATSSYILAGENNSQLTNDAGYITSQNDGFDFDYGQALNFEQTGAATSTHTQFSSGLQASSTSYFDGVNIGSGGLLVSGTATSSDTIIGAIDTNDSNTSYRFNEEPDEILQLQRDGGDATGSNDAFTLLDIVAPTSTASGDYEATLALSRGTSTGGTEALDLYNNGYSNSKQHGIRIQKRDPGKYRDFVFDFYDGTTFEEVYRIASTSNHLMSYTAPVEMEYATVTQNLEVGNEININQNNRDDEFEAYDGSGFSIASLESGDASSGSSYLIYDESSTKSLEFVYSNNFDEGVFQLFNNDEPFKIKTTNSAGTRSTGLEVQGSHDVNIPSGALTVQDQGVLNISDTLGGAFPELDFQRSGTSIYRALTLDSTDGLYFQDSDQNTTLQLTQNQNVKVSTTTAGQPLASDTGNNISSTSTISQNFLEAVDFSDDTNATQGNLITFSDDTINSNALATSSIDTASEFNSIVTDGALDDDDLSDNSTTDLSEGTNLYYTDARVNSVINASSTIMNTVDFDTEAEFEAALFNVTTIGETVDDTELTAEDFGDWTSDGTEDGVTLDAGVVADNEIDYTNVTLSDFTIDSAVYDFGGVTSLEIPNGSDPTVDAGGEVAVNTSTSSVRYHDGTSEQALYPAEEKTFSIATSTLQVYSGLTSSSTIAIGTASIHGETWESLTCYTDSAGTAEIEFGDGTNWIDYQKLTTTVSTDSTLTNNTFVQHEKRFVRVGQVSSDVDTITCTAEITKNAD